MLSWPIRVFVWTLPTDMRKGFPGLAAIVREHLGEDPMSGDLYVFANRRGDLVKCLYHARDGYVIIYKQLDHGTFRIPRAPTGRSVEMTSAELSLLLNGADVRNVIKPRSHISNKLIYDRNTRRFALDNAARV